MISNRRALDTRELTRLRKDAENHLPDFCTIQVQSEGVDTVGGPTESFANTYQEVPCRLAAFIFRDRESILAGRIMTPGRFTLTLPWDQEISLKDRVVHEGETYEVVALDQDTASWRTAKRVDVARVD
ncbi:MAG: head-tail adaptor protein [Anaerolineae bacterium]|nr:head-tail adaptor protein [Anaerolineae bacterium]NIN98509.1 head-tail adaptor protein [Anaerolineae bacterium]